MKFIIFATVAAGILSVAWTDKSTRVRAVESEILSYVHENLGGIPMMRGGSAYLACYDTFTPLINEMAARARNESEGCVGTADLAKLSALDDLNKTRSDVEEMVAAIQQSLENCSAETDSHEYFDCLLNTVEPGKARLDKIALVLKDAINAHDNLVQHIDADELHCHQQAVSDAKAISDKLFEDLKKCITP